MRTRQREVDISILGLMSRHDECRVSPEQLEGLTAHPGCSLLSTLQGLLRCFPDHPSCCVS